MDATHADGLWVRDLLATAGRFVPLVLAALLLGLAYLVLDPTPPRHVVLATGPARSDVAEFGACISSVRPVGLAPRGQSAAKGQHVGTSGAPCPSSGNGDSKFKCLHSKASVRYPPGLIVALRATSSDESTTGVVVQRRLGAQSHRRTAEIQVGQPDSRL